MSMCVRVLALLALWMAVLLVCLMNASIALCLMSRSRCMSELVDCTTSTGSYASSDPRLPGSRRLYPICLCAGLKPLLLYMRFFAASTACMHSFHSAHVVGRISSRSFVKTSLASPPWRSVRPCCHGALAPMTFRWHPASLTLVAKSFPNSRPWSRRMVSGMLKTRTHVL